MEPNHDGLVPSVVWRTAAPVNFTHVGTVPTGRTTVWSGGDREFNAMMIKEISVERLSFTCAGCGNSWIADYDVQHIDDGHGHERDYFFHDGLPCVDPTARGVTVCARCRRHSVMVRLLARRASPAVTTPDPQHPGEVPTAARAADRSQAPPLPGTQTPDQ